MWIVFSPYNLLFGLGIAAAFLHGSIRQNADIGFLVTGAVLFFGVGVLDAIIKFHFPYPSRTLLFGLGATLAVIGLANTRLPKLRWLVFLGDASYSIYLVHGAALSVLGIIIRRAGLHEMLSPLPMLALVCAGAVLAGAICHTVLERPLLKWAYALLKRRKERKSATQLAA